MIEKMKLLHITGPREDIDRAVDQYLSRYEIHFENVDADLGSTSNVKPFVETNGYREAYQKAKELWESMEPFTGQVERMKPKMAEEFVNTLSGMVERIRHRQEELRQKKMEAQGRMEELVPFRGLDYELHKIQEFQFIAFRFGRIAREYYRKMMQYVHRTDYVLFYECHSDANYVWGAYFVPELYKKLVDAVCLAFHFEGIPIPDSLAGTPEKAYLDARKEYEACGKEIRRLDGQIKEIIQQHSSRLTAAYTALESYCRNFEVRKFAVCTRSDGQGAMAEEYYILYGWLSEEDAVHLERAVETDPLIHVLREEGTAQLIGTPPTRLKNPKIFQPFEMFVKMYGLPAYNEMDPTIFLGLTYTLMFGMMFGDVGQGICLMVGGFLLYRAKGMSLGGIISLAGVWSTVFGFLYGSIFGIEEWMEPLWMRPMGNIMKTLFLAIGFGMLLIMVAMVLNIINAVRAREIGRLFFDSSGLAGLICYGSAVAGIAFLAMGRTTVASMTFAALIGLPLLAILLKEPLSNLAEKKEHMFPPGSKLMYFVEALVELFDVVLSYATNSISFVRVGAFALSHAGMMSVVLSLAGYESGSPNWLVVALGNLVVMGLEGLVVGIQVLRLEYYEMFSRFYRGTGKAFQAFFGKKELGGNEKWQ
ncbi:MAG: V-type ATPase 116kDa subunit family protein [Clostridiales bacterium]|nr:V-type ATPase 116kDa subunit family protein [Clostridiales bacterium]